LTNLRDPSVGLACVILVNWNGWRDTVRCIESCENLTYPNFEIVVVDNGSTDDSVDRIRKHSPSLDLIETGSNLGFAGGNNVGIHIAMNMDASYIWLLNNDTIVDPAALNALVNVLHADSSVGLAASKIYYQDKPNTLWYAGGYLSPTSGWSRHRGVDEIDEGQYDELTAVEFATGCSVLARASAAASIGPMDERYFLYWEDVDWSERARRAGWRVVYVPNSRIWHKLGGSTTSGRRHIQWRYEGRNRLLFYRRHRPLALTRVTLSSLFNAVYLATRGRARDSVLLLLGMLDAARGHSGIISS
jgi:GT2 family glycosyltransferase